MKIRNVQEVSAYTYEVFVSVVGVKISFSYNNLSTINSSLNVRSSRTHSELATHTLKYKVWLPRSVRRKQTTTRRRAYDI